MVPSVPTPPAAMVSAESDLYLGLLIMATFWALFSATVVAVSAHEGTQREAAGWTASFATASLFAAYCFARLL